MKRLLTLPLFVILAGPLLAQTDTPTETPTSTPTITNTPTITPTITNTPTGTPTRTPTLTPTDVPTASPTITWTPGPGVFEQRSTQPTNHIYFTVQSTAGTVLDPGRDYIIIWISLTSTDGNEITISDADSRVIFSTKGTLALNMMNYGVQLEGPVTLTGTGHVTLGWDFAY